MSDAILLKKITLKAVSELGRDVSTGEVTAYFLAKAKAGTELLAVAGEMTGYGLKKSQFGDSFFLTGIFFALNRETGKLYKAGKIYLPKDATENIVAKFEARTQQDEFVKFQLTVKVVEDKSSSTGYSYVCEPIRSPESIHREAELIGALAALPAPKPQAKLASNKK
jgi:hypothetical protein